MTAKITLNKVDFNKPDIEREYYTLKDVDAKKLNAFFKEHGYCTLWGDLYADEKIESHKANSWDVARVEITD